MASSVNLERFVTAQQNTFNQALSEIRSGRKTTHWMWFVFPQIAGLGRSETAKYYGIASVEEAIAYLEHESLGKNLVTIAEAVLEIEGKSANAIFGSPDDMKLHSSMTLFASLPESDPVFERVIQKYFDSKPDSRTLELLGYVQKK